MGGRIDTLRQTRKRSGKYTAAASDTQHARNNQRPRGARSADRERRSIRRIPISRPAEPHYTYVRMYVRGGDGGASVKARSRAAAVRPRSIEVHRRGDLSLSRARVDSDFSVVRSVSLSLSCSLVLSILSSTLFLSLSVLPSFLPLESSSVSNALSVAPVSISPTARCLVARVTRQLA